MLAEEALVPADRALRPPAVSVEVNPHGRAHVSFDGSISEIGTAARDPLFFLLHCNVDRLWAKWQWFQRRFDATRTDQLPVPGQRDEPTQHPDRPQRPRHDVAVEQRAHRRRRPDRAAPAVPAVSATAGARRHADGRRRCSTSRVGRIRRDASGFDYDDVPYEPVI